LGGGARHSAIGDKVQVLHENESVCAPSGAPHRLENAS
jgi:mannose-6-phosphate isomerase-like protein (cupin superfamily)